MNSLSNNYVQHSRWTDPLVHGSILCAISPNPATIPNSLTSILHHRMLAASEGPGIPLGAQFDGRLRSIHELLAALEERRRRETEDPRLFVVCRHYALFAVAILRQHGVPARARAGFARYFKPGFFEDHWVCEYRLGDQWLLLDSELDTSFIAKLDISFVPHDVPTSSFLFAATIWKNLRSGKVKPEHVGLPELGLLGEWFVAASLLRDLAALAKDEVQAWDQWGLSREFGPGAQLDTEQLANCDALAEAMLEGVDTPTEARNLQKRFPWAALTKTVVSYPEGNPIEMGL